MTKKLLCLFALMLMLVFAFAACDEGGNSPVHHHTYGGWETVKEATCSETGSERRACTACEHFQTREVWRKNHEESAVVVDVESTIYAEGKQHTWCTVCQAVIQDNIVIPRKTAKGLAYVVNNDRRTCTVTGLGTCTDTVLSIPKTIDGYVVTVIGDSAFAGKTSITLVVIPETVTTIGPRAFYGCSRISEITVPASVTSIGEQVFDRCYNLKTVYYNSSCGSSSGELFADATSIEKIVFGGRKVGGSICRQLTNLKAVEIKDGVTTIEIFAFFGCTKLTTVTIPDTVTAIRYNAFTDCKKMTSIIFEGTVEEWNAIEKGSMWNNGVPATKVICEDGEVALG